MKRNYISPEYQYIPVSGTFEMREEKNYFSSLLMSLPEEIIINDNTITWYENIDSNQINLTQEELLPPKINDLSILKKDNHILRLSENQNDYEKLNLTKWDLIIDHKKILKEYIFSQIKKRRTFQGILNNDVNFNNINLAIRDYISKNILQKYELKKIEIFIEYNDLNNEDNFKYQNNWTSDINRKIKRFNIKRKNKLEIEFKQEKKGIEWNFDYYFNLTFNLK